MELVIAVVCVLVALGFTAWLIVVGGTAVVSDAYDVIIERGV